MRIPRRMQNQREELGPTFLISRLVKEWARLLIQRADLTIPDHAYHFGVDRRPFPPAAEPDHLSNRPLSWPPTPRHRLVDHNYTRRMALVVAIESAPSD